MSIWWNFLDDAMMRDVLISLFVFIYIFCLRDSYIKSLTRTPKSGCFLLALKAGYLLFSFSSLHLEKSHIRCMLVPIFSPNQRLLYFLSALNSRIISRFTCDRFLCTGHSLCYLKCGQTQMVSIRLLPFHFNPSRKFYVFCISTPSNWSIWVYFYEGYSICLLGCHNFA